MLWFAMCFSLITKFKFFFLNSVRMTIIVVIISAIISLLIIIVLAVVVASIVTTILWCGSV